MSKADHSTTRSDRRAGRRRWLSLSLSLPLLLLLGVGPAAGQSPYVSLSGTVQTAAGDPIPETLVLLSEPGEDPARQTRSGPRGRFRLSFVPPGEYELRVEKVGYLPTIVEGIELEAGASAELTVVLEAGPEGDAATVPGTRLPAVGAPRSSFALTGDYPLLPARDRSLWRTVAVAPQVTEQTVEGLPLSWLGARIGGGVVGATGAPRAGAGALLLPGALLEKVEVRALADVEWEAPAGVAADLRTGRWRGLTGLLLAGEQEALYAGDGPGGAGIFASGAYGTDPGADLMVNAGVAWERSASGGHPSAELAADRAAAVAAGEAHGVDVNAWDPQADRATAVARLEARTGPASLLRVDALLAGRVGGAPPSPLGLAAWAGPERGALVRAAYLTRTGRDDRVELETGVSFDWSDREPGGALKDRAFLAGTPVALGEAGPELSERVLSLSQTVRYRASRHQLKGGVKVELLQGEYRVDPRVEPGFLFGDVSDLSSATGFATLMTGGDPHTKVDLPRLVLFAQDGWQASSRVRLLFGGRFLLDYLPASDIELERSWYFATGEANTEVSRFQVGLEPRLALDAWLDQDRQTRAYASAAVHVGRVSPRAAAELIGNAGDLVIRRSYGQLGAWPAPPADARSGKSLSLPGSSFEPPRTLRIEAGIERSIARGSAVRLTGTYRWTDGLMTRTAANLTAVPWGADNHGRTVWAPIVAAGGVLAGEPGDWFGLSDFDRVWRLESVATSRYLGVTAEARYQRRGGVSLTGRYTVSGTRDDWVDPAFPAPPHAAPVVILAPDGGAGGVGDATSDFDVPHQVTGQMALPLPLPGRPVAGLLYTFRSGLPFTPAMGHGIDADGDGLPNDVAFVDESVPGISPLVDEWSCLRQGAGGFVGRNACRAPAVHRLDAALGFDLPRTQPLTARLRVEILGLISTRAGIVDAALYRATGAEPVVSGATVALPLEANSDFGSVLMDYGPVRSLRVGAEIRF